MDICSAASKTFGFPSIRKRLHLEILKFLVNKFRNDDKKVVLIWGDKDVALERSAEFIRACHNMNIIGKITGGDESSLKGKN